MPVPSPDRTRRAGLLTLLILSPVLGGLLSLMLGQDANWDLRNYHWYNAHAFLTGRLDQDVGPAQVATWYNPTLDLPVYWLAQALPARAVGFLLGAVQGLNLVPLYGIAWVLLAPLVAQAEGRGRTLAAAAVALVCFLGGGQIGLIGTTFYDNVISLFVLGGLWLVVARAELVWGGPAGPAFLIVGIAGLLVGSAVGLKQPTLPYAVGLCFAFLAVASGFWRRMFTAFFFGIGIIAGMLIFSGHWMLHLWDAYQNPLFPYFNHIFESPWATPEAYRDDKFVPKSLGEAVAFPFLWLADQTEVGEIAFRDLRIPVAYVVLIATGLIWLVSRLRGQASRVTPAARYVLAAGVLTYLVWLKLFAIYRYLIPLEMAAPLLLIAAAPLWPVGMRARQGIVAALLVLAAVTIQPGTWGRIAWTDRFVEIQAPELPDPDNTILLQTGFAPTSFLTTGFPPQAPVYRLHSYFQHPDQGPTGLNRKMADAIAAHDGDFYLLVAHWEVWTADDILPRYGLRADMEDCRPVTSNLDEPMMLCRVHKAGA
ncbi:hypothetical protein [Indioceanicola profundi]|uniref:hypothetical protein n=1 Tax=Indioceanicola profundi TaxID=2220096 RepID=UPI001CEDD988|nr:hypothetical protein [Indioceanicola profundi]